MLELWLVFALLAVIAKTGYYATQKQRVGDESAIKLAFIPAVYGTLIYTPIAIWFILSNTLTIPNTVIAVIIGGSFLETLATITYVNLLDEIDLGLATTVKGSSIVFVALLEPLLLPANYSIAILVGALLATLGIAINSSENTAESLLPTQINSTLSIRIIALLIFVLFTYVALSLISRFGNSNTPSIVYGGLYFPLLALWSLLPLIYNRTAPAPTTFLKKKNLKLGGWGVGRSIIWAAYALASASTVTITSRLVIPAQILVGTYYFNEQHGWRRLLGAALIIIGAALAILH